MSKPVEFSSFFKILYAAIEGDKQKKKDLANLLVEYQNPINSESNLHELGQVFLYVGLTELYRYAKTNDIEIISKKDSDEWNILKSENKSALPPSIANRMIAYAKEKNLSKTISEKWKAPRREIEKNTMNMARYLTEGIIEAID